MSRVKKIKSPSSKKYEKTQTTGIQKSTFPTIMEEPNSVS